MALELGTVSLHSRGMDNSSPYTLRPHTAARFLAALFATAVTLACHSTVAPTAEPSAALPAPAAPPAAPQPTASQPVSPDTPLYLVVYRAGPGWPVGDGMPPVLREHFRYLLALQSLGELKMAGPFASERGGAAVFHATDDAAAQAWLEADPAVRSQVFQFELRRWSPVDWEKHAQRAR